MRTCLFLLLSILLLVSCGNQQPKDLARAGADAPVSELSLKHAKGFSVVDFANYRRVEVYDPWQEGLIMGRYYLVSEATIPTPADGQRIVVPIKRMVTGSTTHYGFLSRLNQLESVVGVCDGKRIFQPHLRAGVASGSIVDLGDPFQMDVEKCMLLNPDLIMVSGYNQMDEHTKRLMSSGLPVVLNNEWMEPTLLGRAEWIYFIACFFNQIDVAKALFDDTERRYVALQQRVLNEVGHKPTVLSGDNFRGTWYQPGGRSYTAQLIRDAGGYYPYQADSSRGSIPMSFERVFFDLKNADVWVGVTNGKTKSELLQNERRYEGFKPFQTDRMYAYTNRITEDGGNDFWEMAVASPDGLLADFIHLFHPERLPNHTFLYVKKLP
ncbi:MAG: ABC transporter substrate-binding protein [Bacteroidales bacterium]|jgi:iron complex transport system substrate-binding protein|nr:ABC transporter substrate-binding protein [Bacteroidales bacterium]HKL92126.1 ABC transporter substrate-binding protein [Bacteroidales bacterium]